MSLVVWKMYKMGEMLNNLQFSPKKEGAIRILFQHSFRQGGLRIFCEELYSEPP